MERPKIYRVGFLGCGFIGKVHAYAYRTLPFYYDPLPLNAHMAHVVTGHPDSAERARQVVGADSCGTDFRHVTENPDIDIVHICTPNHLHREALVSALEHDKHIYCDKPLVAEWSEVDQVLAAVQRAKVTTQMTFQNRFFPSSLCARRLVDRGEIGEVLGFRVAYLHGGSADPKAPLRWKLSAEAGGGVIADLASHVFDFAEYLVGPIVRLMATTHIAYPRRPSNSDPAVEVQVSAEDSVVMLAQLPSGATGTLEATKIATGSEDELRCEVHGSKGALRFNLMDPHHLEFYQMGAKIAACGAGGWTRIDTGQRYKGSATGFPSPKASIGWLRAHVACLANFLQAISDGRAADPDLLQGVRVQRLMEAARRSAAEQRWIDVCP